MWINLSLISFKFEVKNCWEERNNFEDRFENKEIMTKQHEKIVFHTMKVNNQKAIEAQNKWGNKFPGLDTWELTPSKPSAPCILNIALPTTVAETNSRDKPSWLFSCCVWNVNWQPTGLAPVFSVQREWVSYFCPSICHRASLAAAAAVVSH